MFEIYVIVSGNTAPQGVSNRVGLFEDFLQHEVRISLLLRTFSRPGNAGGFASNRRAFERNNFDAMLSDCGHFTVVQEENIPSEWQQRWNIGSYEVFLLAQTDNNWRAIPRDNNFFPI